MFFRRRAIAVLVFSLLMLGVPVRAADPVPSVVVSIKPIHSLVSGVMAGAGEPVLLIPDTASPHDHALRPSDARALEEADAVFWVGDLMEGFLSDALDTLAGRATVVTLIDTPGIDFLALREGGVWETHDHGDHGHDTHDEETHAHEKHDHDDAHGHDDEPVNAHVWLDPTVAKRIVARTVDVLSTIDPARISIYKTNADALLKRLDALDEEIAALLEPVRERPFIVFHDAYPYFERRYGLTVRGSITLDPDHSPGARRVADLRDVIVGRHAVCVFAEPQFEPAIVTSLIEGTPARSGQLDPIGVGLLPGPDVYFQMMRRNAEAMRDCLDPTT